MDYIINVDGSCPGNPGTAAGAYIRMPDNAKNSTILLNSTNNEAEWAAITLALEDFSKIAKTGDIAEVRSDSSLVVNQLLGNYGIEATSLLLFYNKCKSIIHALEYNGITVHIVQIPREANTEADKLARAAVKAATIDTKKA